MTTAQRFASERGESVDVYQGSRRVATVRPGDTRALDIGIEKLGAVRLHDGEYAYYDDGMGQYYIVDASDIESYVADYIESDDEQISGDAYSHWCAGTTAKEMPKGWTPDGDTAKSGTLVVLESMPDQHRSSHRAAGNFGVFPHNGSYRYVMPRDEAEEVVESDADGYDHIVRAATNADIERYGTDDRPDGW